MNVITDATSIAVRDWNKVGRLYRIDPATGRVISQHPRVAGERLSGIAKKQGIRKVVVVYKRRVRGGGAELVVQSGRTRLPISSRRCRFSYSTKGLSSRLQIWSDESSVSVWGLSLSSHIMRVIDPTYDAFVAEAEDFVSWLRNLLENEDTQAHLLGTWG